ncbi:MAG: sugar ABC transporter permease [Anaerolineaceae bacterium]|nr:sugar ABC transporter permease [Anaerolineaceae bacterium]
MVTSIYPFGQGWQRWIPYLLIVPGLFTYFLVALGPSLATSLYSFTDATGVTGAPINWIGFDNYQEFLFAGQAARDNLDALGRTIIFSVVVSTVQFGLGLLVAILLTQGLRGTYFFRTLFFMPVILGVVIQGLIWTLFLYPLGGPVSQIFNALGIESELLGGTGAFWWVIVVQIWANMGITMIIFIAGLQTISAELYESAQIDGASSWQRFRHVTWPLLTPTVNTNILLNIIGSLQAWQLFLVITGYRPGTQVLGYVIYAQGFGATGAANAPSRQGFAAAASIVLFLLVLVVGLTTQTVLNRREKRIM